MDFQAQDAVRNVDGFIMEIREALIPRWYPDMDLEKVVKDGAIALVNSFCTQAPTTSHR